MAGRALAHVAPIVTLKGSLLADAARDTRPNYIPAPWFADDAFADLDQMTAVDRSVLATIPLLASPEEDQRRHLAYRLGRYLSRAALPDNVNRALSPLQKVAEANHPAVKRALGS